MPTADARFYEERILSRYRKVWVLSQQGASGERESAQGLVAKFQGQHPGIHEQAFPPAVAGPSVGDTLFASSWEAIWGILREVPGQVQQGAEWMAQAALEAAQIEVAQDYADEMFSLFLEEADDESWTLVLTGDLGDMDVLASTLTPLQKEVLADAVAARVRSLLRSELTHSDE